MSSTNERLARPISGGSDAGETPETPEAPPQPTYVTAEAFQQAQQQTANVLAQLNETMQSLSNALSRPVAPAAPPPTQGGVTLAQYVEALQTGDVAVVERYQQQQEVSWVQKHVAPLQEQGLNAIANLTAHTTTQGLPYYSRWKKEIDAWVANMPPNLRMEPGVYKAAHDAVVGSHAADLISEAKEAALRGDPAPAESADAGRRGRGGVPVSKAPTPEDLGGAAAVAALRSVGKDSDTFARKLGYDSWEDYMTKTAAS